MSGYEDLAVIAQIYVGTLGVFKIPKRIIMVSGSRPIFNYIRRRLKHVKKAHIGRYLMDLKVDHIYGFYRDIDILVFWLEERYSIVPLLVMRAFYHAGAKIVITIGYSYSIRPNFKVGDILIPLWGCSTFSLRNRILGLYKGRAFYDRVECICDKIIPLYEWVSVDPLLASKLYSRALRLKDKGVRVILGGIASIAELERSNPNHIINLSRDGVYALDYHSILHMGWNKASEYMKRGRLRQASITLAVDEIYSGAKPYQTRSSIRRIRFIENMLARIILDVISEIQL